MFTKQPGLHKTFVRPLFTVVALASIAVFALACGSGDDDADSTPSGPTATSVPQLSGTVELDGSSTVFPLAEAVAEEFSKVQKNVRVNVGLSGTGGGFTRFCKGETAISNASRPITEKEQATCAAAGIEYIEIPVAYDALSVVVNPQNNWVTCITEAELKKIWEPAAQNTITKWNQVNAAWPDADLKLFAPGTDSGTFDYFTEHIVKKAKDSRGDFTASEDDNVLVQGVAGDKNALGYFGLAYLEENKSKIKALQIDAGAGKGCVTPSAATVEDGSYSMSRPLFIYVKKTEANRPEVKGFVDFFLANSAELASDVGYVKFPTNFYPLITTRWTSGKVGTMYTADAASLSLLQKLQK